MLGFTGGPQSAVIHRLSDLAPILSELGPSQLDIYLVKGSILALDILRI